MYFINIGVLAGTTKEKHDAKFVFADFENKTGWDNNFVSWSIGLLSALYAFFSLDGATHYCEEMDDADIYVPRASEHSSRETQHQTSSAVHLLLLNPENI